MIENIFVFGGGNTKGAFTAGAAFSVIKSGITPDLLFGTSIGAINAFLLSRSNRQQMYDFWNNIEKRSYYVRYNWRRAFYDGIYDFTPTYKWLKKFEFENPKVKIPAQFNVIDLDEGDIEYGDTLQHCIASATEPLMRPLTKKLWFDGGIREQNSLQKALEYRPKRIWAFANAPFRKNPKYEKTGRNLIATTLRSIDIMTHEVFWNDLAKCCKIGIDVRIIAPDYIPYDPLTFDRDKIRKFLQHGVEKGTEAAKL